MKSKKCIQIIVLLFFIFAAYLVFNNHVEADVEIHKTSEKVQQMIEKFYDSNNTEYVILLVEMNLQNEYENAKNELIAKRDSYAVGDKSNVNQMQQYLVEYRKQLSEININNTQSILSEFMFQFEVLWVSKFTPYVKILTLSDNVSLLESNEHVEFIEIVDPNAKVVDNSTQIGPTGILDWLLGYNVVLESSSPYKQTTGIDDVITNYDVDGTGINIAILEVGGGVDTNNPELSSGVFVNETTSTDHATTVAIIAAGRINGIASNSNIVAMEFSSSNQPLMEFEELVDPEGDYPANVINCSWEYTFDYGQYDGISRWIDHFIQETLVSIVFAAGNAQVGGDYGVSNVASAKNVIAVGSTSANGEDISLFSRYENDDDLIKPLVVAPGGDITIEYNFIRDIAHIYALDVPNSPMDDVNIIGTSFAAPQVTGAIALMMQYENSLILQPHTLASVIACGASNNLINDISVNTNDVSDEAGSGLVDFQKSFQILENGSYIIKTNSYIYNLSQYTIKSVKLSLIQGEQITVSSFFVGIVDGDIDLDNTNYNFLIYGPTINWNYYWFNGSLVSNLEKMSFTVPQTGYYYIDIIYKSKSSNDTDYICVSLLSSLDRNVIYSTTPSTC